jgi:hypothetical protein
MAFATITKGFNDLENQDTSHRIRQKSGGRKKKILLDPTLVKDVQEIVEASTMGSPKSPLLWCSKSVRNITNALNSRSPRRVSHALIPSMLDNQGCSLQGNRKTKDGGHHLDRNAQFEFMNQKTKKYRVACCLELCYPMNHLCLVNAALKALKPYLIYLWANVLILNLKLCYLGMHYNIVFFS